MKTARVVAFLSLVLYCTSSVYAQTFEWIRQLGSTNPKGSDVGSSVSADGLGSVFISGCTYGSLDGINASYSMDGIGNIYLSDETNTSRRDAFVSKFHHTLGTLQWTRQLGTISDEASTGVSADGLGNVYITGWTSGNLGGDNTGNWDVFISKYNAKGTLQWTRQFGTSSHDLSTGISADGLGNVYISGQTNDSLGRVNGSGPDVFISKYDTNGTLQWTRQPDTIWSESTGVSANGLGNVYISGWTEGNLEGAHGGFVAKYDASGTSQWTQQIDTARQARVTGVSADGLGNVYISGWTSGNLRGAQGGFVAKYDASGTNQWTQQIGTNGKYSGTGVSADGQGNVYISGQVHGNLGGARAGHGDAFVAKYDASGTHQWTQQIGTAGVYLGTGVSADGQGNVYISGRTHGDAFVAKYKD